jgi:hypothetical protein
MDVSTVKRMPHKHNKEKTRTVTYRLPVKLLLLYRVSPTRQTLTPSLQRPSPSSVAVRTGLEILLQEDVGY